MACLSRIRIFPKGISLMEAEESKQWRCGAQGQITVVEEIVTGKLFSALLGHRTYHMQDGSAYLKTKHPFGNV